MSIYTDGTYSRFHPTWHSEDSTWKAAQVMKMLKRQHLTPRTVCEVGCGAGGVLAALAAEPEAGTYFEGFEISPDAYRLAVERQSENVRFYLQDLLGTGKSGYDLALALDVIEHVEDVFGFLRHLQPRAEHKIFHIPLDMTVVNLLRPNILRNLRNEVGHLHYFTKDIALALLVDAGFEIIDWFYTPWAFELKTTTRKIAALNPLRRMIWTINPGLTVRLLGGYSILVLSR